MALACPSGLPPFLLLGAGPRRKLVYQRGVLWEALTGTVLARWPVAAECLDPHEPAVTFGVVGGKPVAIWEDEQGIWLDEKRRTRQLASEPVALPDFAGHPHAGLLRRLLHELLVNLVPAGPGGALAPVPNLLVYRRPWYRDAALVALCLRETGHLDLIADWVRGLHEPFDRNNGGETEPDNLGQALTLIGLVCGPVTSAHRRDGEDHHRLIPGLLQSAELFREGEHLVGITDGAPHPVYQTKWLKYGLRLLNLPDDWGIPAVADSYSSLFWLDYRDQHVPGPACAEPGASRYPYLPWAEAHFHDGPPPQPLDCRQSPLTWETHASQADYDGMAAVGRQYCAARLCTPHTWHAAEMLLYLLRQHGAASPGARP